MISDLLRDRIRDYAPSNALEQENVLQELVQHYVLASLARARFFAEAAFHGGTCLRILFALNRFSEDLDFLLRTANPRFDWAPYLARIERDGRAEGIAFETTERSRRAGAVRTAFVKTDLAGPVDRRPDFPFARLPGKKLRVKLEIDCNPPEGSAFETRYIHFPVTVALTTQTLASSFALKSHALLCRSYTKGRDWYDFLWYTSKEIVPDWPLLRNALRQQGPWAGRDMPITPEWYRTALASRIEEIDWAATRDDVIRFVTAREREGIALWDRGLFLQQLERLARYLDEPQEGR